MHFLHPLLRAAGLAAAIAATAAIAPAPAGAASAAEAATSKSAIPVYGYEIVHTYPHDRGAFTEGLFYKGGFLYESTGLQGEVCEGMTVDEGIILELVVPGTGEPVPPGEVGEVVVTTLTPEYPLIRFATGDLSALLPGPSPCGRTNHRIKGWLGRADQATKVRGMFVHPEQVAEILRRHKSIIRARLVVERPHSSDEMTLLAELREPAEDLGRVVETLQSATKLRGTVSRVPEGSLPADGKLIEDRRQLN